MKYHIRAEAGESDAGGSGEPKTKVPPPPAADSAKSEETGDSTDEFGYAKSPEGKVDGSAKKDAATEGKGAAKVPPVPQDEKIEKPATGYGIEPPKEEVVSPVVVEPPKVELGYELEVKDGLDPKEVAKVKEFAKANTLTKEAAQALMNLKSEEFKAGVVTQNEAKTKYETWRKNEIAGWDKELRADPTFGGDRFVHNLMRAEKVLDQFLPTTKKALTERGSTLPPYVMRDLAKLADHLYSTENLTLGDPEKADTVIEIKNSNEHLDFYNS